MKRRDLIALLGCAAAWPLATHAQQAERLRRIGVLMGTSPDDPEGAARLAAFLQALQQFGWVDGSNARIDIRWGASDLDRIRQHASELIALAPDVILAGGGTVAGPLLLATRSVRSSSRRSPIRSAPAWFAALRGREATPPGSRTSNMA